MPSVIGAAGGLALPVGQRIWFVDWKTGAGRSVELGASALNAVAAAGMLWVVVQADSKDRSGGRLVAVGWEGPDVHPLVTPPLAAAMGFQIESGTVYAVAVDGRLIAVRTAR